MKVGDKVYSKYFKEELTITRIEDDKNWWFTRPGQTVELKAKTPLSYFEAENG